MSSGRRGDAFIRKAEGARHSSEWQATTPARFDEGTIATKPNNAAQGRGDVITPP